MKKQKLAARIPVGEWEKLISSRLCVCTMLPGSFDKRFSRNVDHEIDTKPEGISDKQRTFLCTIFAKYRKQITDFQKIYRMIPSDHRETIDDYLQKLKRP